MLYARLRMTTRRQTAKGEARPYLLHFLRSLNSAPTQPTKGTTTMNDKEPTIIQILSKQTSLDLWLVDEEELDTDEVVKSLMVTGFYIHGQPLIGATDCGAVTDIRNAQIHLLGKHCTPDRPELVLAQLKLLQEQNRELEQINAWLREENKIPEAAKEPTV